MSGILSEMTIEEVRAFEPEVVVLGVASTEPHGPALPYGTDYWQCDALCRKAVERANDRGARVLMYPTLPIGNNVNFKVYPFACRVRVRTLMNMLLDIIEAVEEDGIRKVVLVNGHGGNTDSERAVLREHVDRTPRERCAFVCMTDGVADIPDDLFEHPSMHGGEDEVSRMLYLKPELVRREKLQDQPMGEVALERLRRGGFYFVHPWHRYAPWSAAGEQRKASAEKGRTRVEGMADGLAEFLVELSAMPWHPDFPYPPAAD